MIKEAFAQELRDVRPPVDYPTFPWMYVAIGLCIICIAGVVYWRIKTNQKIEEPEPLAHEVAVHRLKELLNSNEWKVQNFHQVYFVLSEILRQYIEQQMNIKAVEMTTDEFLVYMQSSSQLQTKHKDSLKLFLEGSDKVKFAKFVPDQAQAQEHVELIKTFILETKGKV